MHKNSAHTILSVRTCETHEWRNSDKNSPDTTSAIKQIEMGRRQRKISQVLTPRMTPKFKNMNLVSFITVALAKSNSLSALIFTFPVPLNHIIGTLPFQNQVTNGWQEVKYLFLAGALLGLSWHKPHRGQRFLRKSETRTKCSIRWGKNKPGRGGRGASPWPWERRWDRPGSEVLATKRIMGRQQENVNGDWQIMPLRLLCLISFGIYSVAAQNCCRQLPSFIGGQNSDENLPDPR